MIINETPPSCPVAPLWNENGKRISFLVRRCNALLRRGISASASPQNRSGERSTAESRADSLPPDEGQAGWHHSSRLPGDHRQKAGATGSSVGRVTQRPLHTHDHTQTLTEREREAREESKRHNYTHETHGHSRRESEGGERRGEERHTTHTHCSTGTAQQGGAHTAGPWAALPLPLSGQVQNRCHTPVPAMRQT